MEMLFGNDWFDEKTGMFVPEKETRELAYDLVGELDREAVDSMARDGDCTMLAYACLRVFAKRGWTFVVEPFDDAKRMNVNWSIEEEIEFFQAWIARLEEMLAARGDIVIQVEARRTE